MKTKGKCNLITSYIVDCGHRFTSFYRQMLRTTCIFCCKVSCPSVCPSRSSSVPKNLYISSKFFHQLLF